MRCAFAMILFTLATPSLLAAEYGKWIASSERMHDKSFESPVLLAKHWAEDNLDFVNGKFDIEYHVVERGNGYVIYLDPIYPPGDDGRQLSVTDDEWCIFVNGQNKIENAEQCLSP